MLFRSDLGGLGRRSSGASVGGTSRGLGRQTLARFGWVALTGPDGVGSRAWAVWGEVRSLLGLLLA